MKKLTIVLSDEEYAALAQHAQSERRSVRQMAERLVTQPQQTAVTLPYRPWNPVWPPNVWCGSGTTDAPPADGTTIWGTVKAQ